MEESAADVHHSEPAWEAVRVDHRPGLAAPPLQICILLASLIRDPEAGEGGQETLGLLENCRARGIQNEGRCLDGQTGPGRRHR